MHHARGAVPPAVRPLASGFTLVELLIVIGIIALLLSITLPSLGHARRQAKLVQCASRLKQCYTVIYNYCQDHRGAMPFEVKVDDPEIARYNTTDLLLPYAGNNRDFFRCPEDRGDMLDPTPLCERPIFGASFKYEGRSFSHLRHKTLGNKPLVRRWDNVTQGIEEKPPKDAQEAAKRRSWSYWQVHMMRDYVMPWEEGQEKKKEGLKLRKFHLDAANVLMASGNVTPVRTIEEWKALRGEATEDEKK